MASGGEADAAQEEEIGVREPMTQWNKSLMILLFAALAAALVFYAMIEVMAQFYPVPT